MRLLVLGASGKCGRWVVELAARQGHQVTALVRPNARVENSPRLEVIRGDVLDSTVLTAALKGQDAVVSCLGMRRSNPSPWSKLLSPSDLVARVTRLLVDVMPVAGVHRLVWISAGGVGESFHRLTTPVQWLIRQGQIRTAYADLENAEHILAGSNLDWLAVRPVTLVPGTPSGRACPVTRYGFMSFIRRADVADYMIRAVEQQHPFNRRTVLLGSC